MQHDAIERILSGAIRRGFAPAVLRVADHTTGELVEAGRGLPSDSPLLLASVTKLATAACVHRAVDAGRLALTDPALPLLDDDVRAPLAAIPGSGELTVGDLLSQTSGLPDPFEEGWPSLAKRVAREDFSYTPAQMAGWAAALKQRPRNPNRAHYSDANFDLLGVILERIHGRPYAEILRAEVAEPLGLEQFRIPAAGEAVPAVENKGEMIERPEFLRANGPSGGAVATALELEKFTVGLFTGELCDTTLLTDPDGYRPLGLTWGPITYGPGAMRIEAGYPLRPKTVLYGHIGSTGSLAFWAPEKQITLVGSLNQFGAGPAAARLAIKIAMAA